MAHPRYLAVHADSGTNLGTLITVGWLTRWVQYVPSMESVVQMMGAERSEVRRAVQVMPGAHIDFVSPVVSNACKSR